MVVVAAPEDSEAVIEAEQHEERYDNDDGDDGRMLKTDNGNDVGVRNPVSRNKGSHPSEFVSGFVNMSAMWYFVFMYRS